MQQSQQEQQQSQRLESFGKSAAGLKTERQDQPSREASVEEMRRREQQRRQERDPF